MAELTEVAPALVEMAHRIVWCTGATTRADGRPRSRILHPIWEWDGTQLRGWVATSPLSPKAADLADMPAISLNYWDPSQDTATADCATVWEESDEERRAGWQRFADAPPPYGYDPTIIPGWDAPDSPTFGILRLEPYLLRVLPGVVMMGGEGEVLTWERPD